MVLEKRYRVVFSVDDEELDLLVEAVETLRLYQQGFTDVEGNSKLTRIRRLENHLRKRKERRQQRGAPR